MQHIIQVYLYELQRNITRKGFWVGTLALPVIALISILGFHLYQTYRSEETPEDVSALLAQLDFEAIKKAGYVDESGIFATVPEEMTEVLFVYPSIDDARTALNADEIDVFYVILADYAESGEVVLHLPQLQVNLLNDAPIEQLFYRTVAGDIDQLLINRLRTPANFREVNLQRGEGGQTGESEMAEFWLVYVFVILFLLGITITNNYLMQSVIEERENRLIEILISTVSPTKLLAGKILAMSTLGLLQIVIWLVTAYLNFRFAGNLATFQAFAVFNLTIPFNLLPIFLLFFALMYVFYASIFAAIGTLSNSVQEGGQYVGVLIIPAIIPFYLLSIIQNAPHGVVALLVSFIPITAPTGMMTRMIIADVPVWQVLLSIGGVALLTAGGIWFAGRIFRVQTLLAGQTPKLKDLPSLLFREESRRKAKES